MIDLNEIMNMLTLVLLALGGYVLMATKTAVKTSTEEAAKAAIRQFQWPAELARELQKTRGVERQELRFKSYGAFWKELRPLAIYDATVINKKTVDDLNLKLSDWYFSECGGLFLTPQARDFYFALQDLLRTTSEVSEDRAKSEVSEEWSISRSGEPKYIFREVLNVRSLDTAIRVLNYFEKGKFENWQEEASDLGKNWKDSIKVVAAAWNKLSNEQRFATLQQVGSKLRSSLTIDIESRLH